MRWPLGVQPAFEFPFENNSLTENLLEFGEIRLDTRAELNYEGDADTGVVINIHFNGASYRDYSLQHGDPGDHGDRHGQSGDHCGKRFDAGGRHHHLHCQG